MTKSVQAVVVLSLALLAASCAMLCAGVARASAISPLPASDYLARSICGAPVPGRAHCVGSELVPETVAARERNHPLGIARARAINAGAAGEGAFGLRPQDLRSAYFPSIEPDAPAAEPQTIALVDAYNDPNAEAGLQVYDQELHLPECTGADGCFGQVNENGETGKPPFPEDPQALVAREAICEQSGGKTQAGQAACLEVEEVHAWALESSATSSSPTRSVRTAASVWSRRPHLNRGTSKRPSRPPRAPRAEAESAPPRSQTPGALRNPRPTAKRSITPGS